MCIKAAGLGSVVLNNAKVVLYEQINADCNYCSSSKTQKDPGNLSAKLQSTFFFSFMLVQSFISRSDLGTAMPLCGAENLRAVQAIGLVTWLNGDFIHCS